MLSTKQKVIYLEKRTREYMKSLEKSLTFQQKMIMQATISSISNLIKTTKNDKIDKYFQLFQDYLTVFLAEYETVEQLEEALDSIMSHGD